MRFTWDENKRKSNLRKHGLDFADCAMVFSGETFTVEDRRYRYDERRFITIGELQGKPVSIIHTEHHHEIRIISFRNASSAEINTFYATCGRQLD
ncbi:BrnT family toxin [Rugamonas apoptosis]|uniref:BrnT family toxin n=1 Tax=Rugamonas apoptosis TaxID=2758570 RepID=A0A7W2ILZ3_9BURK|nr:BrnT family toxin [Rugamonas apoptosis]MBA5689310.1 BrnT family toxin [Rugamonas apoptosis]